MFARARNGWWTPLLTGLLGVAFYAAMVTVLVVVALVVAALAGVDVLSWLMSGTEAELATFDLTNPLLLAVLLGTIARDAARVHTGLAHRQRSADGPHLVGGRTPALEMDAAVHRRRRRDRGRADGRVVPASGGRRGEHRRPGDAPSENPMLWASLAVILLVVPLQAAAEEYVFRGYLQQAIGRWLRHPAFAILLPVPLFVLGHLYDPLGQAAVGLFAVVAGWLTWRTGGLEAAIALHVVNNLSAFLLALAGLTSTCWPRRISSAATTPSSWRRSHRRKCAVACASRRSATS